MLHMARIKTECESVDGSSVLPPDTHRLRGFILAGMGSYLFHLKRLTVLYCCMFKYTLSLAAPISDVITNRLMLLKQ